MEMTFNPETGAFIVVASGDDEARHMRDVHAWDVSRPSSRKVGRPVFFTRDPYAAVPLFRHADGDCRQQLARLVIEYDKSFHEYSDCSVPLPPWLDVEPAPFQRAGVAYAADRPNVLIGDQMGLGKTAQAILLAAKVGAERILVVCPGAVRIQWVHEIRRWFHKPNQIIYPILRSADGVHPRADWTVISYDLTRNPIILQSLLQHHYDMIILDEGHYLKSFESKRTQVMFKGLHQTDEAGETVLDLPPLAEAADRVVALTGTPLPNRPRECYTLMRGMAWDAIDWTSEERFRSRYNPSYFGREKTGHLPELRARLRCNLMIRRLKKDVLKQLPEERYELTYVEPNGEIRRVLKAEKMLDIDPTHLENVDPDVFGHISTLRKEMGIAKIPRIIDHVKALFDGGLDKVAVYVRHREVMAQLYDKFADWRPARIWGGQTPLAREREKQRFIEDPECRVFLGQNQAAGTGLDGLQKVCSHVVLAEPEWVPGENDQIVFRLSRMGQSTAVLAQFLVAPGSYDEKIISADLRKRKTTHQALDAED